MASNHSARNSKTLWKTITLDARAVHRLEIDPHAELLPQMTESEYQSLKHSIRQQGQLSPIILFKNRVLDGRHRLRACRELGISPKAVIANVQSIPSPLEFVISTNITRRHLNDSQKAILAAKHILPRFEEEFKQRRANNLLADVALTKRGRSSGLVGNLVGVSARTVATAKSLLVNAPDLAALVEKGDLLLHPATRILRARQKQREIQRAFSSSTPLVKLLQGDFSKALSKWKPSSIDLIFTDPPYASSDIKLWHSLGVVAKQLLRPGGFLIAIAGNRHANDFLKVLDESLAFIWLGSIRFNGRVSSHPGRMIISRQRPIFFYAKPKSHGSIPKPIKCGCDYVETSGSAGDLHPLAQNCSQFSILIDSFCPSNGTVLDPFAGGGSLLWAAYENRRNVIGVELSPKYFQQLKSRFAISRKVLPLEPSQPK